MEKVDTDVRPMADPCSQLEQTLQSDYLRLHPNDPDRSRKAVQHASEQLAQTDCRRQYRKTLHGA